MKSKAGRSEPSSHRSRRSSTGPGPSVLSSRSSISMRGSFALQLLRVAVPSTRSSCTASHRRRHLLSSSGEMHSDGVAHGSSLIYFISCWDASERGTGMVQRASGTQRCAGPSEGSLCLKPQGTLLRREPSEGKNRQDRPSGARRGRGSTLWGSKEGLTAGAEAPSTPQRGLNPLVAARPNLCATLPRGSRPYVYAPRTKLTLLPLGPL